MNHLTLLNLLDKEALVQIASVLLTENVALKSRLEQSVPRVEKKVIEPVNELNSNVHDWLHQSNQSVSQSHKLGKAKQARLEEPSTATSLEEANQPTLSPQGGEADDNNIILRKLFVRNISFKATPQDLAVAFSKYGNVEYAKIQYQRNRNGYTESRGYGFIIFSEAESANRALRDKIVWINGRGAECYLAANGEVRPVNAHQ